MNIHHDLAAIQDVASHYAKEHNCRYTVLIHRPDSSGKFSISCGSTYEFVADSYFNKERTGIVKISEHYKDGSVVNLLTHTTKENE